MARDEGGVKGNWLGSGEYVRSRDIPLGTSHSSLRKKKGSLTFSTSVSLRASHLHEVYDLRDVVLDATDIGGSQRQRIRPHIQHVRKEQRKRRRTYLHLLSTPILYTKHDERRPRKVGDADALKPREHLLRCRGAKKRRAEPSLTDESANRKCRECTLDVMEESDVREE